MYHPKRFFKDYKKNWAIASFSLGEETSLHGLDATTIGS